MLDDAFDDIRTTLFSLLLGEAFECTACFAVGIDEGDSIEPVVEFAVVGVHFLGGSSRVLRGCCISIANIFFS